MKVYSNQSSEIFDEFAKQYTKYQDNVQSGNAYRIKDISSREIVKLASFGAGLRVLSATVQPAATIAGKTVKSVDDIVKAASEGGAFATKLGSLGRFLGTGNSWRSSLLKLANMSPSELQNAIKGGALAGDAAELVKVQSMLSAMKLDVSSAMKADPGITEASYNLKKAFGDVEGLTDDLFTTIEQGYISQVLRGVAPGEGLLTDVVTAATSGGRGLGIKPLPPSISGWETLARRNPDFVAEVRAQYLGKGTMNAGELGELFEAGLEGRRGGALEQTISGGRGTSGTPRAPDAPVAKATDGAIEAGSETAPAAARLSDDAGELAEQMGKNKEAAEQLLKEAEAVKEGKRVLEDMGEAAGDIPAERLAEEVLKRSQDMTAQQMEVIRELIARLPDGKNAGGITIKNVNQNSIGGAAVDVAKKRKFGPRSKQARDTANEGRKRRPRRGGSRRSTTTGDDTIRIIDEADKVVKETGGWRSWIPSLGTAVKWGVPILVGGALIYGFIQLWKWIEGSDGTELIKNIDNGTIPVEGLQPPAEGLLAAIEAALAALRAITYTPGSAADTGTQEYVQFLDVARQAAIEVSQDGYKFAKDRNWEILTAELGLRTEKQKAFMDPSSGTYKGMAQAGEEADHDAGHVAVVRLWEEIFRWIKEAMNVLQTGIDNQAEDNANPYAAAEDRHGGGRPGTGGGGSGGGTGGGDTGGGDAARTDQVYGGATRGSIPVRIMLWGQEWLVPIPATFVAMGGRRIKMPRKEFAEAIGEPGRNPGPVLRALNTETGRAYVGLGPEDDPEMGAGHSDWNNLIEYGGASGLSANVAIQTRISLAIQRMVRRGIYSSTQIAADMKADYKSTYDVDWRGGQSWMYGGRRKDDSAAYKDEMIGLDTSKSKGKKEEKRRRRDLRRQRRRSAEDLSGLIKKSENFSFDSIFNSTNIDDLSEPYDKVQYNKNFSKMNKKADKHSNEYFKGAVKGLDDGSAKTYYAGFKDMYNERPDRRPKDMNSLYMLGDETGSELVQRAHPKSIVLSEGMGRGGLVENLLEQHQHGEEVAFSTPTGNYRSKHAFVLDELKGLAKKARSENNAEAFEMIKGAMIEIVSLNPKLIK